MAKSVPPCAAFGDWRCISESLRGVGVASASSLLSGEVIPVSSIYCRARGEPVSNWLQVYRSGVSPTRPKRGSRFDVSKINPDGLMLLVCYMTLANFCAAAAFLSASVL